MAVEGPSSSLVQLLTNITLVEMEEQWNITVAEEEAEDYTPPENITKGIAGAAGPDAQFMADIQILMKEGTQYQRVG